MGISGETPARINPMDIIQLADPDAPEQAMSLADSIVQQSGKASDPFWQNESKAILQGLMMHVAFDEHFEGERHSHRHKDEKSSLYFNAQRQPSHFGMAGEKSDKNSRG